MSEHKDVNTWPSLITWLISRGILNFKKILVLGVLLIILLYVYNFFKIKCSLSELGCDISIGLKLKSKNTTPSFLYSNKIKTNAGYINIRDAPSLDDDSSKVIGSINNDEPLIVINSVANFHQIVGESNSKLVTGYISKFYDGKSTIIGINDKH